MNRCPQFTTEIDGQTIHFIHVKSKEKNATPLLLIHGWPGSIVEFLGVIDPLTDPVAHGGKASEAFDVVIPSLPGFGFSGPTHEPGWNHRRIARAFIELMGRLGYDRFGVQGGDAGAIIGPRAGAHRAGQGHSASTSTRRPWASSRWARSPTRSSRPSTSARRCACSGCSASWRNTSPSTSCTRCGRRRSATPSRIRRSASSPGSANSSRASATASTRSTPTTFLTNVAGLLVHRHRRLVAAHVLRGGARSRTPGPRRRTRACRRASPCSASTKCRSAATARARTPSCAGPSTTSAATTRCSKCPDVWVGDVRAFFSRDPLDGLSCRCLRPEAVQRRATATPLH